MTKRFLHCPPMPLDEGTTQCANPFIWNNEGGVEKKVVVRKELGNYLSGQKVLPEDWTTRVIVISETGRRVVVVSSGTMKVDKETWWWNHEVHHCKKDIC